MLAALRKKRRKKRCKKAATGKVTGRRRAVRVLLRCQRREAARQKPH